MGVPLRVLMIEDSEDDAALLVRELRRGGYDVNYERVDTPAAMSSALNKEKWDMVISDHSMPHFSGAAALKLLRQKESEVPFIFVSGTMGEEAAVAALKDGAQDYVMKTNLKRLVPAVQRELREVEERRQRKLLERQVQQLQKFEAIGRLAGGIAHDFNNAIGAIMGWADLALQEAQPGTRLQERLKKICAQSQRTAGLTSQLLAFARQQVLQPRRIDLNGLIEEGTSLLRKVIGADVEVRLVPAPNLRVTVADPVQIDQVLMNLCLNARDAMPKGGRLIIETQNADLDEEYYRLHAFVRPGSYVLLSVSDTGIGMDAATIERIFEPFFTTKEVGKGTGLGLATVFGIVKQHGGFINVYSEPGKGTTFRVYLPSDHGAPDPAKADSDEGPAEGTETILLAEDHEGLRELAQETLEALGYRVVLATNGTEAVELFKTNSDRIDLVILDVVMPGLSGPDAYSNMSAIRPNLAVVFATGYTAEAASLTSLVKKGATVLQKPYSAKSLSQAIRGVLGSKQSSVSH
ncbi:MAG TPA: response regulator [Candidatus Acidoferrum sp.]|nr:response regulator [Candidatus Dormibacteraeota bacterium]HXN50917.1 response regulator [Candidatus Acidoferrum sp.]